MEQQIAAILEFVIKGDRQKTAAGVRDALAGGASATTIMTAALIPAMLVVGEKFSTGEYFLPQMMIAARAMQEGLDVLKPALMASQYERKGKAVIGTVAGDFHDIGKNIVRMMLEGAGYEVMDLGVDVSPEAFVRAIEDKAPRFVLLSALITLTMESMRQTIAAIRQAGLRDKVFVGVGGAPLTQRFADEIGADFYSEDAHGCVLACNRLNV